MSEQTFYAALRVVTLIAVVSLLAEILVAMGLIVASIRSLLKKANK